MGSFYQHITCSTATGVVLGGAAVANGFSLPVSSVSAGLCALAGMLPDIDSDTSKSFQECIYLAAGLGAVLTTQRLRNMSVNSGQIESDIVLLCGVAVFLFIRFVVGWFIKRVTAHRGMVHSIPAAILGGEIVFLLATGTHEERLLKAAALTIGYLSHLILDEVFSIDSTGQVFKPFRLKKSFGTALKWNAPKKAVSTFLTYTCVCSLGYAVINEWNVSGVDSSRNTAGTAVVGITPSTQTAILPLVAESTRLTVPRSAPAEAVFSRPSTQVSSADDYMPPMPTTETREKPAPAPIVME